MSLPQFDPEVEVTPVEESHSDFSYPGTSFSVSGKLDEELDGCGEKLRVLVSVWQTQSDTKEGGDPTELVAHGVGIGQRDGKERWSAKLDIVVGKVFRPGSVTGLAHAVGNNGDPGGFVTYTWTRRLQVENP